MLGPSTVHPKAFQSITGGVSCHPQRARFGSVAPIGHGGRCAHALRSCRGGSLLLGPCGEMSESAKAVRTGGVSPERPLISGRSGHVLVTIRAIPPPPFPGTNAPTAAPPGTNAPAAPPGTNAPASAAPRKNAPAAVAAKPWSRGPAVGEAHRSRPSATARRSGDQRRPGAPLPCRRRRPRKRRSCPAGPSPARRHN